MLPPLLPRPSGSAAGLGGLQAVSVLAEQQSLACPCLPLPKPPIQGLRSRIPRSVNPSSSLPPPNSFLLVPDEQPRHFLQIFFHTDFLLVPSVFENLCDLSNLLP